MNFLKKSILVAALGTLSLASHQALAAGSVTASQAAAIAEKRIGGIATDVDYERDRRGDYYDVEVRKSNGEEWDVRIDARTGKVIRTRLDYDD